MGTRNISYDAKIERKCIGFAQFDWKLVRITRRLLYIYLIPADVGSMKSVESVFSIVGGKGSFLIRRHRSLHLRHTFHQE